MTNSLVPLPPNAKIAKDSLLKKRKRSLSWEVWSMEVWIRTRERKKIDWAGSYHENDAELHHPQNFCQEGFTKS